MHSDIFLIWKRAASFWMVMFELNILALTTRNHELWYFKSIIRYFYSFSEIYYVYGAFIKNWENLFLKIKNEDIFPKVEVNDCLFSLFNFEKAFNSLLMKTFMNINIMIAIVLILNLSRSSIIVLLERALRKMSNLLMWLFILVLWCR